MGSIDVMAATLKFNCDAPEAVIYMFHSLYTYSLKVMEIEFPIEFLVHGTSVSFQRKRGVARAEWQERVKQASMTALPTLGYIRSASKSAFAGTISTPANAWKVD